MALIAGKQCVSVKTSCLTTFPLLKCLILEKRDSKTLKLKKDIKENRPFFKSLPFM